MRLTCQHQQACIACLPVLTTLRALGCVSVLVASHLAFAAIIGSTSKAAARCAERLSQCVHLVDRAKPCHRYHQTIVGPRKIHCWPVYLWKPQLPLPVCWRLSQSRCLLTVTEPWTGLTQEWIKRYGENIRIPFSIHVHNKTTCVYLR